VVGYPEGRITLDPGLWPERGKTGLARLALATDATVVPVAQWGAHEMIAWDRPGTMLWTALTAAFRRPTVRVHFGEPVDLAGLTLADRSHAQRAADRITEATIAALRPLRVDEPGLPRYVDPTRPVSTERSYRSA
jgi:1-acyl-sn-glycerol-3-phosphate acyltransferase